MKLDSEIRTAKLEGSTQVWVGAGETLTVWLDTPNGPKDRTQVELRVTPSGKPEIFLTLETKPKLYSFRGWYPMEDKG